MAKKNNKKPVQVESIKHQDKRANIPTEELRDFVAEEEKHPKTILYPRDTSLDPQLVWKGKDEQDQEDLAVPAVPIYIQEKIHPQAIIENVRQEAAKGAPEDQFNLFADFNGIEFEDLIDFYQHEQNWSNRMILGDSLYVMTSLAEKEGLKGKVQMIYLDPPYGIKFGSNWQVSTRKNKVADGKIQEATRQPEQIKAYRDTWMLGINSYLSYLRDRLTIAHDLLTDTGSIFVQIGDENEHLVRSLLDEIFGSENFVACIAYKTSIGLGSAWLDRVYDNILWFGKNKENIKYHQLFAPLTLGGEGATRYTHAQLPNGERVNVTSQETYSDFVKGTRFYTDQGLTSRTGSATTTQPFTFRGKRYSPSVGGWRTSNKGLDTLAKADRILEAGKTIRFTKYFDDFGCLALTNFWSDLGGGIQSRSDPKIYVVQTSTAIIQRCLLMTTDPGDLVLDPTCGGGTTAFVAEQWGRRWITIDTSRVALALARTRIMAAKYPYYILADSKEGLETESEINGKVPPEYETHGDIRKGFAYNRVPHIILKDIANNGEIDDIYAKWHEQMEPVRKGLNKALKKKWEEWEIPFEADKTWPKEAQKLHKEWWEMRRQRQAEIDASIARNSDQEILYDQPYEDNKRIRVAGPFTVESLSPHRVLSGETELPESEAEAKQEASAGQFEAMIIDNLKTAGVQNTYKNERLKFDRLEPYAGTWIQAEGEYTEKDGTNRRVAVAIGPEHGTVGPDLIKEAAKEAVQGIGFDVLVICGFSFDPHVSEEAKRYGKLAILITRMNPDLSMGDELLKKTGSGNLFMVFGEPDIDINKLEDGKLQVQINGLDIYDPTTGEIRNSSTDDIACWFIDTNYNGESFFVRHAYFTGSDKPYDKLQKALRAEIDEAAWSMLYSTESYPFDPPETGKIAVKVINHYGDEVLKVYEQTPNVK